MAFVAAAALRQLGTTAVWRAAHALAAPGGMPQAGLAVAAEMQETDFGVEFQT